MYPVSDHETWHGIKSDPTPPVEDTPPIVGNVSRSWQWRERGTDPPSYPPNKKVFENIAEDILVQKPLQIRSCDLPGYPRSTFLMVFSPDGTKVASTHGNHNVYVSELASGKHVRILKGHPRTPWCIAFHPSHPQLIGSGCLGGQVRVWDIASGGSEVWNVRNETVIASIAFHPRDQLLVIATCNELYFWDWSHSAPFTKVSTNNINEKVRFVAFDSLGYKLITGISLWSSPIATNSTPLSTAASNSSGPSTNRGNGGSGGGGSGEGGGDGGSGGAGGHGDNNDDAPGGSRPLESPGAAQDMIVNSYQTLVQRYDSLVRNYQRLFMVRQRLNNTPPLPNTIDRGTDPMETYPIEIGRRRRASRRSSRASANNDSTNPSPSTSTSRTADGGDSGDGESSSSRFLNLDVLSFDSDASRTQDSPNQERSAFGSSSSAFQPLNDSGRSFRTVDQNERTRLLPNPFSSRSGTTPPQSGISTPRIRRFILERTDAATNLHSSRTSIFTSTRPGSMIREFTLRRRNLNTPSDTTPPAPGTASAPVPELMPTPAPAPAPALGPEPAPAPAHTPMLACEPEPTLTHAPELVPAPASTPTPAPGLVPESAPALATPPTPAAEPAPSTSTGPTTTNSSTQMSPDADSVDAQSINESLDLIRDILRDSGTRLLNLITNMSMNLMSGREGRDRDATRWRPHMRIFTSSESDSDHTDILRTPNSAYREPDAADGDRTPRADPPTDRMVFELGDESLSSGGFRVRIQNDSAVDDLMLAEEGSEPTAGPSTPAESAEPPRTDSDFDPNVPSTSRDDFWSRGPEMPPAEAYRRVRRGVCALQKHTLLLAHMWIRGDRLSMKQLRIMWENLRRRILALQRETRQETPSYYTRSLLERCMLLTEITDYPSRYTGRRPRSSPRNEENRRNTQETATNSESPSSSNTVAAEAATRTENTSAERRHSYRTRPTSHRNTRTGISLARLNPFQRRRLLAHYRALTAQDLRRRRSRLLPRQTRREFARAFEMSTTRHEIRMRAMQVLSVMFNMMMMCLGERGLSQVIMHMLKALKKALALSCFMMMSNRNNPASSGTNSAPPAQNVDSMDVVRIQNAEHAGPVNVDGPDDPASPRVNAPQNEERPENASREESTCSTPPDTNKPSTSQASTSECDTQTYELPTTSPRPGRQRWSHRLAVQIAAANRNNSTTARTRRDIYIESKRQKALHRTNPVAHPFIKKRLPPVASHRIPALRSLPSRRTLTRITPRVPPQIEQSPVAGPSTAPQHNPNQDPQRGDLNDFDNRVNLIRIAHMQAVRLRNAARNRFRRLQPIRLYTPSSVFALHPINTENQPENGSAPQNNAEGSRRPFVSYGPHLLSPREVVPREMAPQPSEAGQFHAVLNNVAMPLMQVNDLPPVSEANGNPSQRLPRIHEYLQPIILAQNAMVVDDMDAEGGGGGGGAIGIGIGRRMGGMAGLIDAGIISEALPAPSNRVQAWDFTTGRTPEIANSSKNVVVQRCRIHNDASIDISKDGRLLVALLPGTRLRNTNSWLGVYSLEWGRLGHCLHTAMLEQSAVSVALSPTARYLAVGLGSRRFTSAPHSRTNIIALLYKLDPLENSSRTGLAPIKELMQHWEHGFTSLNCLRWAPQPGQGLVYANNTGQLIIMS